MSSRFTKGTLVFLFLLAIIFSSCAPVYYPNVRNSPMFTKAGEFQGSGFIQPDFLNEQVEGIEAQGAVSISNHIALMGNFSYGNNRDERYRHYKFFDGGIGYYQNKDKWCHEIFAGYGVGEGSAYDENDKGSLEAASGKFRRFFIQPAVALNKNVLQFSFIPRIALVDFTEYTSNVRGFTEIANPNPQVFIEPAAIVRLNLLKNRLFISCQSGLSVPVSKVQYDYRSFYISAGIGFRLGGVRKEVSSQTE
jgi:hypothetical protein